MNQFELNILYQETSVTLSLSLGRHRQSIHEQIDQSPNPHSTVNRYTLSPRCVLCTRGYAVIIFHVIAALPNRQLLMCRVMLIK